VENFEYHILFESVLQKKAEQFEPFQMLSANAESFLLHTMYSFKRNPLTAALQRMTSPTLQLTTPASFSLHAGLRAMDRTILISE
jgi:hypothetical protein